VGHPAPEENRQMTKTICRPERKGKPGPKTVRVTPHTRTTPKPIRKDCGK